MFERNFRQRIGKQRSASEMEAWVFGWTADAMEGEIMYEGWWNDKAL